MSIKTKYYYGAPGSSSFNDAELSNTTIFAVTRSGWSYVKRSSGTPVSLEFTYDSSIGGITFDTGNPFYTPEGFGARPVPLSAYEKISVKFRSV